jgi:hypothetical protein
VYLASLFVFSGALALHVEAGHADFLPLFAFPLLVYCFWEAVAGKPRFLLLGGALLGLSVLNGGLHVMPLAAVLLGALGLGALAVRRSPKPMVLAVFIVMLGCVPRRIVPAWSFARTSCDQNGTGGLHVGRIFGRVLGTRRRAEGHPGRAALAGSAAITWVGSGRTPPWSVPGGSSSSGVAASTGAKSRRPPRSSPPCCSPRGSPIYRPRCCNCLSSRASDREPLHLLVPLSRLLRGVRGTGGEAAWATSSGGGWWRRCLVALPNCDRQPRPHAASSPCLRTASHVFDHRPDGHLRK